MILRYCNDATAITMFCHVWIYVLFLSGGFLLHSHAAPASTFLTEPKPEPYFVKPGDPNLVIPCSINPTENNVNMRWMKVRNGEPSIIVDGTRVKRPQLYELDCPQGSQPGCFNLKFKQIDFQTSNGDFYCQVERPGEEGDFRSTPARVTVLVPPGAPNITSQPTIPVRENELVHVECQSLGGNPAPQVSWLFSNGSQVNALSTRQENQPESVTRAFLTFAASRSENKAVVLCRLSGPAITAELKIPDASTAPFLINYPPKVSIGPASPYNIESSSQVSLVCLADSNPPITQYGWSFNGIDLPGFRNQHLNFTAFSNNSGLYVCEVDGPSGRGQSQLRLNVYHAPEIRLETQYRKAVGQTITVVCLADAFPPVSRVTWSGPNGFSQDGDALSIGQISLSDMGNYTCQASNEMELTGIGRVTRTSQRSTLLLVDHRPGKGIVRPATDEPTVLNGAVNLTCTSDDLGSPPASFKWRAPGAQNQFVLGQPFLTVQSAKLTDSGSYACLPFNEIGQGEPGDFRLVVYVPAQMETQSGTGVSNQTKSENESDFKLVCMASGHPAATITWFKDGEKIDPENTSSILNRDSHWSLLPIVDSRHCENNDTCLYKTISTLEWQSPIRWSDKGSYECSAYNGAGRPATRGQRLIVNHKPVIINDRQRGTIVAVDPGQPAHLSCRVNARPEPATKWLKDGAEIASGADYAIETRNVNEAEDIHETVLTVKSTQNQDMGEYTCKAANSLGDDSLKITLQLKAKPMNPSGLKVMSTGHNSALLVWTPGFDGGEAQVFIVQIRQTISGLERQDNVSELVLPQQTLSSRSKRFVGIEKAPEMIYNATDLLPGSDYHFKLKASNRLGDTEWSETLAASTSDTPADSTLMKPTEAAYSGEKSIITFKPTNLDPSSYCILLYRRMPTGKMMVENCYSTSLGQIENVKPSATFKVRFCRRADFSCGPDLLIASGNEGPFSWQVLAAIVASVLFLIVAGAAILTYCYKNRRENDKKSSPQLSTSSSIVAGQVVSKNSTPANMNNPANRHGTSASKDSGLYSVSLNGGGHASPTANIVRYDAAMARRLSADGGDSTSAMDLSPAPQQHVNNGYDHSEHWGATEGYPGGATKAIGAPSPQSSGDEQYNLSVSPLSSQANTEQQQPITAADYQNQRRIMKEIIV